jgi:hypothetical protein
MLPLQLMAAPAKSATGTWKVDGDVQGTPVILTCVLTEADHKLTGKCTGSAGDTADRAIIGETTEKGLGFQFNSAYQGTPIIVSLQGSIDPQTGKMLGTIFVDPLNVDGTFSAVRATDSPAPAPAAATPPPDPPAPTAN